MRKNIINTIFRKEIREVVRDKRMLYLIILLPFFTYPVMFALIGKVGQSQQEKMATEKVTLLVNPEASDSPIVKMMEEMPNLDVQALAFDQAMIDTMKGTIGLQVMDTPADTLSSIAINIFSDNSKDLIQIRKRQVVAAIKVYEKQLLQQRLAEYNLSEDFIHPISIEETDLASEEQKAGKLLGSMLPMLLLIFIFVGCIYIAIDITSGEKERKTLQTLFTAPISVKEIIAGKFLAVFSVGILSAFMNLVSLMLGIAIQVYMMAGSDKMGGLSLDISVEGWLWISVIVFLTTIFLAAMTLAVVQLANSYKEAQSYVSPMMMLILIPAMLSQMPGMELNATTAMIPILNISLALGAVFKGAYDVTLIAIVAVSVLVYVALALGLASKIFNNESVTTGQKVGFKRLFTGK